MAKVTKVYHPRKKTIGQAADKVSTVIHSCANAAQIQAADKMVTAFRKLYSLHYRGLYYMKNLCAELQLKRIVIVHLQPATA